MSQRTPQIKGSIVCVSSSNGWSGTAGVCAYAFHKGGVNNFVRAAAMDLAPYGIRVNSFTLTAPNPDNPELLAVRAKQGHGPGGVLSGPPGGGLGGARAKNFAYTPAAPDQLAGPLPLINLDSTLIEGLNA